MADAHPDKPPASESVALDSATGERFFQALVERLARALAVENVLIAWRRAGEPPELETVAFWSQGGLVPNLRCRLEGTPCELTMRGEEGAWERDAHKLFPGCEVLARLKGQAYVGLPLTTYDGDALGVLAVVDSRPLEGPERVLAELHRFAPRAAAELARKRDEDALRARETRLRRQNEALVALARGRSAERGDLESFLREATEAAARTLDLDRVLVSLFDPGGLEILRVADLYVAAQQHHESGAVIATADCPAYLHALEHERCLDVVDAQTDPRMRELWESYFLPLGVRSTLDAPIRMGGRLLGVLCSEHAGGKRHWHADETQFAASLADLVSLGIEAAELARTQRELRLRNRELSALHRVSEISQGARSLGEALASVAREVAAATGCPQVWIQLAEADGERLVLAASEGLELPPAAHDLERRRALSEPALDAGRPQVRQAAVGERLDGGVEAPDGLSVHAAAPLVHEGHVLGALNLGRREGGASEPDLVALLRSLSRAVAGLIARARGREQAELLEVRVRQAQHLEAIGTLAGGVAHDFNNLLTGVLGYTWLLKQGADPGGEVYRAASVIENAAERAAELTRQLLGFARQGMHQEVPVDLHELMREVTALLGRTFDRAISVGLDLRAERPLLRGDPGQLHQALLNLAINARDAMETIGGELTLSTADVPDAKVPRRTHPQLGPGNHVLLTVRDTGEGVAAEHLPHIFEPFFTTKEQGRGTGMGLAMVYGTVQAHTGAIEVESRVGAGSVFRLYLPCLDPARGGQAPEQGGDAGGEIEPQRGVGQVLVVDDEELVRAMAQELLSGLGYRTLGAHDGLEALEVYRERGEEIDLVLLDLVMPRMGGRECLRALKRVDPDVRVLLSSGWQRDDQLQGAMEEGATGFLPKPYQLAVLAEAVARALHA